jgi:hypothetical protein
MAKNATKWDNNSGATATQLSGALQLESSASYLLLQNGTSHLLFEGVTLTPKENTLWDEL